MSSTTGLKILLGSHAFGGGAKEAGLTTSDSLREGKALLDAFHDRGFKDIDTARIYPVENYGASELFLGQLGAASTFTIHTKVFSGESGAHKAESIARSIEQSLEALNTDSVETMFLHIPDRDTPFDETLKAMHDAYRSGKFKHLGLSNYTAAEVQQILDVCESKGYNKPAVYEGHYNAIVRGGEEELFPLLRRHNIAFWAYSPAAGGLFSGQRDSSKRWQNDNFVGTMYSTMYGKPAILDAVTHVFNTTAKHGISGHAAVLRWVSHHSQLDAKYGDGIVFSVSKLSQLEKTIDALEAGPLPADLADAISAVYATVKGSEPAYHQ